MRIMPAALAATVVCGTAAAAPSQPPERYDRAHPNLVIVERNYREIDPLCREMFPRSRFPAATETHRITGCADIGNGTRACRIFVPQAGEGVISADHRSAIIRHETAHCNGWPASHAP